MAFSPPISKIVRTSGCVAVMALTRQRKSFSYVAPMSGASCRPLRPVTAIARTFPSPRTASHRRSRSGTFRTGSPRRRSYERMYPFPAPGSATPSGSRNVPRRSAERSVEPSGRNRENFMLIEPTSMPRNKSSLLPRGNMGPTCTSHTMVVPGRRSLTNRRVTDTPARRRGPGPARSDNRLSDRTYAARGRPWNSGARRGIVEGRGNRKGRECSVSASRRCSSSWSWSSSSSARSGSRTWPRASARGSRSSRRRPRRSARGSRTR